MKRYFVRSGGKPFGDGTKYVTEDNGVVSLVSFDGERVPQDYSFLLNTIPFFIYQGKWVEITEAEAKKLVSPTLTLDDIEVGTLLKGGYSKDIYMVTAISVDRFDYVRLSNYTIRNGKPHSGRNCELTNFTIVKDISVTEK